MIIGRVEIKDYVLRILPKKVAACCPWCEERFKTRNVREFNGHCSKVCLGYSNIREKKREEERRRKEFMRKEKVERMHGSTVPIIGAKKDEDFSHGHTSTGVYGGFSTTTYGKIKGVKDAD